MSAVAVLGLGLMGGSLVRDLSDAGRTVAVWSPDREEVAGADTLPGVRGFPSAEAAAVGADTVVLAAPLAGIRELLSTVPLDEVEWVQDLGSLQQPPVAWAAEQGLGRFVSAHPLVGSEASGWSASRKGLYRGARVFLSHRNAPAAVRQAAEAFWRELGALPEWRDPEEHDRVMAWVSHLPQVVATHLADLLREQGIPHSGLGPGGRDTTRLAGSSPEMWEDIFSAAPTTLGSGLRDLARRLSGEADRLDQRAAVDFARTLKATGAWRAGEGEGA